MKVKAYLFFIHIHYVHESIVLIEGVLCFKIKAMCSYKDIVTWVVGANNFAVFIKIEMKCHCMFKHHTMVVS